MRDATKEKCEATLRELHNAWSEENMQRTMACFAEGVIYSSNIGEGEKPLTLTGKRQLQAYLATIMARCECASHIRQLAWREDRLQATLGYMIRHRATGHELRGTSRQVVSFLHRKIQRVEDFYDAARLMAFVRLIRAPREAGL